MPIKKCEKCGAQFEAREERHRTCPKCHREWMNAGGGGGSATAPRFAPAPAQKMPSELLLKQYYDGEGNVLKEVFIGPPQKIATMLEAGGLSVVQLRNFFAMIGRAKNTAMLKGFKVSLKTLYQCNSQIEYQLKRDKIKSDFADFMRHHLELAQQSKENLEGFYDHLDSIVSYFPVKQ
jgi:CRISPR/Cas system CSM-associated protein Csm2 small subunit